MALSQPDPTRSKLPPLQNWNFRFSFSVKLTLTLCQHHLTLPRDLPKMKDRQNIFDAPIVAKLP